MKLPISIAKKLLQMVQGERLPASSLQYDVVQKMVEDGVVQKIQSGKSKAILLVNNGDALLQYVSNRFSISNLQAYVDQYATDDLSRSEAVMLSGNSKLKSIRTFKGFLVNAYSYINASLQGQAIEIKPPGGSAFFVHNYDSFTLNPYVTVVGVENSENFFCAAQQQYLFESIQPLFVSRYPQGHDLIKWLQMIPNPYLHFGDFDFEGINIYLYEYKRYLGDRATFFIPENIEALLVQYGNRELYNRQQDRMHALKEIDEPALHPLVLLFHKHKKCLEQEVLIKK